MKNKIVVNGKPRLLKMGIVAAFILFYQSTLFVLPTTRTIFHYILPAGAKVFSINSLFYQFVSTSSVTVHFNFYKTGELISQ